MLVPANGDLCDQYRCIAVIGRRGFCHQVGYRDLAGRLQRKRSIYRAGGDHRIGIVISGQLHRAGGCVAVAVVGGDGDVVRCSFA